MSDACYPHFEDNTNYRVKNPSYTAPRGKTLSARTSLDELRDVLQVCLNIHPQHTIAQCILDSHAPGFVLGPDLEYCSDELLIERLRKWNEYTMPHMLKKPGNDAG